MYPGIKSFIQHFITKTITFHGFKKVSEYIYTCSTRVSNPAFNILKLYHLMCDPLHHNSRCL